MRDLDDRVINIMLKRRTLKLRTYHRDVIYKETIENRPRILLGGTMYWRLYRHVDREVTEEEKADLREYYDFVVSYDNMY